MFLLSNTAYLTRENIAVLFFLVICIKWKLELETWIKKKLLSKVIATGANQKFCNILVVRACLEHIYQVTEAVQAVEGTRCGW